ncbi:hypothetical protein P872_16040 [Rhodonellum psychrophilum GCM71 = DSM 17998]|uniref:Signal transduction histidine kinase internal region domain-containing protein n=2 Tax=Rhodonellum TaxID=336827 RepID=U5BZW3_9BACT|nr:MULTISPECIES: histidine kinase [Rhodonellum]ERM83353.1 hypothetical protein P872_16040 [Rhodonellum psychrophilum GCM71 = DSM 17998]MDO9551158.1 histidine kinase [Rhodonellum sp.]SDZ38434.1 Histidine kinase [Rhodonellum ikkaensis]
MKELVLKKQIPLIIHILGWSLFGSVIFLISPLSAGVERPNEFWIKQGLMFASLVATFYFNYFYLVPKVLFKNKTSIFLLLNLIGGLTFVGIFMLYDDWTNMSELMHKAFRPDVPYKPRGRNYSYDFFNFLIFIMAVGISTSVAAVQKWQSDEKVRVEREQQQINSELSYLKAQINPHFFFNTLNNIYSLTNIDVEKAKTAILKLSRMMRYVLYETEKENTLLSKELDFIKDFIELMRLRLSEKVELVLEIPEKFDDAVIAPMLLLPFVENCFKHGISSQKHSKIQIHIQIKEKHVYLNTVNFNFKSSENTPEGAASGIGLANTKRRLELLYKEKHSLDIKDQNPENEYRVNLKIDLK